MHSIARIASHWTALAAFSLAAASVPAVNIVVTSAATDEIATDGVVSLREAITAAETDAPSGDAPAGSGADVITFDPSLAGQFLDLEMSTDTGWGDSAFIITTDVTIDGSDAPFLSIRRDAGAGDFRLFQVDPSGSLTLRDITLRDGLARGGTGGNTASGGGGGGGMGAGGAIFIREGELTVIRSTLTSNTATGGNGGPSNAGGGGGGGGGSLAANGASTGAPSGGTGGANGGGNGGNFSISGTASDGGGGGFGGGGGGGGGTNDGAAGNGGSGGWGGGGGGGGSTLAGGTNGSPGSSLSGSAGVGASGANGGGGGGGSGMGGAIFNYQGDLTMLNSTVSGNTAVAGSGGGSGTDGLALGGGIFSLNAMSSTLTNNTIAFNTAGTGGGVYHARIVAGTTDIQIENTVIADNVTTMNIDYALFFTAGTPNISGAGNLVESLGEFGGTITGTVVSMVDPQLFGLANNGGPTQTHFFSGPSAVRNAGDNTAASNAGLTTDQRGQIRIAEGTVDIGSVEYAFPDIDLSAAFLDLGEQDPAAGPTATQDLLIGNVAEGNLFISMVTLTGADAHQFSILSDTGETTVPMGGTRTLSIAYDPEEPGTHSATLNISSNSPGESFLTVPVFGRTPIDAAAQILEGCADPATFASAPGGVAISDMATVEMTVDVSGLGGYLWDVNVVTDLTHQNCSDLQITLTSPSGRIVTLAQGDGLSGADVFDGTLWDDHADPDGIPLFLPFPRGNEGVITDSPFPSGIAKPRLTPREALGSLVGTNPNGTWTFTVRDTAGGGDTGFLTGLSLDISACPVAPITQSVSVSNETVFPLPNNGPVASSEVTIGSVFDGWYVCDVNVSAELPTTWSSDIEAVLVSPSGRAVTLTAVNGGGANNVFNGTLWDDQVDPGDDPDRRTVGAGYVNDMLQSPLTPEEPLAAFNGEDPVGTWTLVAGDNFVGDVSQLTGWRLILTVCQLPPQIGVDANPLDLGAVDVSGGQATQALAVSNTGTVDLTISDVLIVSSEDSVQFSITGDTGESTLAPGEARTVDIAYDPSINGTHVAQLSIQSDATVPNLLVGLLGFGAGVTTPALGGCDDVSTFMATTGVPVSITDVTVVSAEIEVSGLDTHLWDVNVSTEITHTFNGDLEITLTSPAGTIVTLSTDNGGGSDDVFNGTLWDDQADPNGLNIQTTNPGLVTDNGYANLRVERSLAPEEALSAFIGEDPNGTWVLTIFDDAGLDQGELADWSLQLTTCPEPPPSATITVSNTATLEILDNTTVSSEITVGPTVGTVCDVDVSVEITHTFTSDIEMWLVSPSGRVVTLSTDNGAAADDVFNGTLFDDDADPLGQVPYSGGPRLVTDTTYADASVETSLVPEEPLAALSGDDPAGTWTLVIHDDVGGDQGILHSWGLTITTCEAIPFPEIDVTPASLDFGDWAITRGATTSQPITIENIGNKVLNITMLTLGGANAGDYSLFGSTSGIMVDPGMSHVAPISFDPSATGTRNAMLTIDSDDDDEPSVVIPLTGTGSEAGPTGVTTLEVVNYLLGRTDLLPPGIPDADYNVNGDGQTDAADVTTNVDAINNP